MRDVGDQLEGLIQFQGLNFRSSTVACKHCGWTGTGGALEVPGLAAMGQRVVYACPKCMEAVAVHNGLTDKEVMQEMAKIRHILAEELVGTCPHPEENVSIPEAQPDFAAIRAQLPTAADAAAVSDETPGNVNDNADDSANAKPAEHGAGTPDLDFETIRARLKMPA